MAAPKNTIEYERNTTLPITYNYLKGGVPSSDGITLFFTVKATQFDTSTDDSTAIVKKTLSMSSSATSFTIDPADIADTVAGGNYFYDFKIKESNGPPKVIFPGVAGVFLLDAHPTNREA